MDSTVLLRPWNGLLTRKWPPDIGWPFLNECPAVSYSPTGSPLQYHRRCES